MIEVVKLISDEEVPDDATKELDYGISEKEMENYRSTHPIELEEVGCYKKETWEEYIKGIYPSLVPYYEAVRKYIVENHLKKCGFWHQYEGTPVFNDGKIFALSFRAWGAFAAAVWNTEENERKYDYIDFAWDEPEEQEFEASLELDAEEEAEAEEEIDSGENNF